MQGVVMDGYRWEFIGFAHLGYVTITYLGMESGHDEQGQHRLSRASTKQIFGYAHSVVTVYFPPKIDALSVVGTLLMDKNITLQVPHLYKC